MEIYQIKGLTFSYPLSPRKILKNLTFDIKEGDFVLVCGKSGSGKTSLLKHLKPAMTPHGEITGDILFCGQPLSSVSERRLASEIGYVLQNPDNQLVTDKVWHELAFGLESLGVDSATIRLRVAEMASFFGIQTWFNKETSTLSGGQKQLLNLASIMAMQPKVLILDEPTSQLDPIAATEFLDTIKKINLELGTTIIMSEHRLEETFVMADKVIVMDEGEIISYTSPTLMGKNIDKFSDSLLKFTPAAMQLFAVSGRTELECPISVRDGRRFIDDYLNHVPKFVSQKTREKIIDKTDVLLELKNIHFKYDKQLPDVLSNFNLKVKKNQWLAILGGNGMGKSTSIGIIGGLLKAYRGKIINRSKSIGILPQDPQSLFIMNTVEKELYHTTKDKQKAHDIAEFTEIDHLLTQHPYDLSGGEQQRLALCKVLLMDPEVILLDEPTKGLDNEFKEKLGRLLTKLIAEGKTIVMVSHDIEFCAMYAHECALSFNGEIITQGNPHEFFAGSSFYTTAANRMVRHRWPALITMPEVINHVKKMG